MRAHLPERQGSSDWKADQEFAFILKGQGVLLMPVPRPGDLKGHREGARAGNFRDREGRF